MMLFLHEMPIQDKIYSHFYLSFYYCLEKSPCEDSLWIFNDTTNEGLFSYYREARSMRWTVSR